MSKNRTAMSPSAATPELPAADPQPKPGIGRIVHYITTDPDEQCNGAEVCAAIITGARSDTVVNLRTQPDGPIPERWIPAVPREHSFVPVDGFPVRFWRWPPRV